MVYTPNQNFTPAQDEYSHWMSQWERAKKKNKIKNADDIMDNKQHNI